jgi:hypothetical protein
LGELVIDTSHLCKEELLLTGVWFRDNACEQFCEKAWFMWQKHNGPTFVKNCEADHTAATQAYTDEEKSRSQLAIYESASGNAVEYLTRRRTNVELAERTAA